MRRPGVMTLLCGLLLVAVVAAWIFFRPSDHERALARLTEHGGKVWTDDKDPDKPVTAIDLSFTQDTDAALKQVKSLPTVRTLDLDRSAVTDAGLANLSGLAQLKELDLARTGISDAGLKQLTDLKGLRVLDLRETRVTDDGLKAVVDLKDLRWLGLAGTPVTDGRVNELRKKYPKLQINR